MLVSLIGVPRLLRGGLFEKIGTSTPAVGSGAEG